jgi:hypothetical protein
MGVLTKIPLRWFNSAGFLACAALLGYAYYLELHEGLEPCPLCIFQRVGVIAVGIVFLAAALHNPGRLGRRIYGVLIALTAAAGASVAGRHLWIQLLPADQIPDCGADLEYLGGHRARLHALGRMRGHRVELSRFEHARLGLDLVYRNGRSRPLYELDGRAQVKIPYRSPASKERETVACSKRRHSRTSCSRR